MNILGVHDGHNASACLMVDGKLVAVAEEERFSRLKMDCGYPLNAIEFCLRQGGIDASDIDHVAVATEKYHAIYMAMKMNALMTIDDWIEYNEMYFKPLLYEGKKNDDFVQSLFEREKFRGVEHWYDFSKIRRDYDFVRDAQQVRDIRIDGFVRHLGIDRNKVAFHDHHACHAYYAMYGAPDRPDRTVVFTLDGGGDGSVSTVFKYENGAMRELARTNATDVARMYRYVTLHMGMKPGQHEYKVMGLAPYANEREAEKSWSYFADRYEVRDDLIGYREGRKPKDLFFTMQDGFRGHRFDGIAAAVQRMVETVVAPWIVDTTAAHNARSARFGGGVAMNIKLNMLLAEDQRLEDYYVCPSPTDNTLSIGAAYKAAIGAGAGPDDVAPVDDVYLGPGYTTSDVEEAIDSSGVAGDYKVHRGVTPADVAGFLERGQVVARCSGQMEFGERALGNRSILADARNPETVSKINSQIKYRDFWMPFAPVMLEERAADYVASDIPRDRMGHMMIGSDSTALARRDLPAGLHAADKSMRPQVIRRDRNPGYWDVLKAFEERTGVGGLLNTSFNLHGEPIVCSPKDAISTFVRSGLDVVLMEDVAIERTAEEAS